MNGAEILSWLGETSLAVSVLIVAILVLRGPVARRFGPEAAYLLWIAPLARLVMPELSILPASWRARSEAAPVEWIYAAAPMDSIAASAPAPALVEPSAALVAFWLAGAILFLVLQLRAQHRFMSALLARSTPPSATLSAQAAVLAGRYGLRQAPPMKIAPDATGPLVAGVFRPVIVLPDDFETAYSAVEREFALSHEMAHVARGDLLTSCAALVFRALQWPNPLAHVAWRAFRADQEAACDASVLAHSASRPEVSHAYGAAIVKSAASRRIAPAASLAMSNHIKERLMLIKNRKMQGAAVGRALAAALIVAGVGASSSYSYAAEKDAKKEVKLVKTHKSSMVRAVVADDDETLEMGNVKNVKKIEVQNNNGVRTVRAWDKSGKLISEDVFGPDDEMPFDTIKVVGKDGKTETFDIATPPHPPAPGEPFAWVDAEDGEAFAWTSDDDGHKKKHKVVVIKNAGEHPGGLDCDAINVEGGDDVERHVVCLGGDGAKDPAARAAALKEAIAHMEEAARREAEHREKVLTKLRAELAEAEKEAKKKK